MLISSVQTHTSNLITIKTDVTKTDSSTLVKVEKRGC